MRRSTKMIRDTESNIKALALSMRNDNTAAASRKQRAERIISLAGEFSTSIREVIRNEYATPTDGAKESIKNIMLLVGEAENFLKSLYEAECAEVNAMRKKLEADHEEMVTKLTLEAKERAVKASQELAAAMDQIIATAESMVTAEAVKAAMSEALVSTILDKVKAIVDEAVEADIAKEENWKETFEPLCDCPFCAWAATRDTFKTENHMSEENFVKIANAIHTNQVGEECQKLIKSHLENLESQHNSYYNTVMAEAKEAANNKIRKDLIDKLQAEKLAEIQERYKAESAPKPAGEIIPAIPATQAQVSGATPSINTINVNGETVAAEVIPF